MAKKKVKKATQKKVAKREKSPYSGMSIDQLVKALGGATDAIEKRKIRAQLRKQGHAGGLNKAGDKKKTSKKKTSKKKKSAKKS